MKQHKPAITLIELLIAMSLMAVIVLGAVAFDVASRRFLVSSEEDTALLNELGMALDHINRNVNRATGDASNPGIRWDAGSNTLHIRINEGGNPADYTTHTWVNYQFDSANRDILFNGVTLVHDTLDNAPAVDTCCTGNTGTFTCVANCLTDDAQGGVRMSALRLSNGNYVVSIEDATVPPSDTIYFFPLSHSWN